MEEIRLGICGSLDLVDFWEVLLSDGDSIYSRENLFGNLGTRENMVDMYGDSCENLFRFLAVAIDIRPISSVGGTATNLLVAFCPNILSKEP